MAPDWERSPTRPGTGGIGEKVALQRMPGSVLQTPRQFGPTTRIPCRRAIASSSASASEPASLVSPNPAVTMTSAFAPAAAASSATVRTEDGGTATTTRSTRSGMAQTVG